MSNHNVPEVEFDFFKNYNLNVIKKTKIPLKELFVLMNIIKLLLILDFLYINYLM